jgi:putative spermidine/putrescine transport system substrate-binding protein
VYWQADPLQWVTHSSNHYNDNARQSMDAYSRRRHLQHWAALGLVTCASSAWSQQPHHTERSLRVLAWPGYAEPEVVKSFERLYGVKVELTTIDSDDALWQRISARNADDFDVFAINTAELQRCIRHGLVRPVLTERMLNLSRQLPRFQQVSAILGLVHDGLTMAIPFTYSEIGLIYDAKAFAEPPASVTELWQPRHKGRVLVHNSAAHSFSLAAQAMGLASPFKLSSGDWPQAVERLIALRRNVAAFYTQPQESLALYKQRHAVLMLANYGSQQLQLFRQAGLSVGYTIPQEGRWHGWIAGPSPGACVMWHWPWPG